MDPEIDHAGLISVDPGKKGPSRVPSWPKLGWKFTRTCRCTPISRVFWHIDVCVMFSRGQILLEIHDAIAMRTQTWVGKKCDAFTRANSVQYSQCHCYVDTNLGGKKFTMLSRGVLGIYRCTLAVTGGLELINQIHFCHTRVQLKISNVFVILQSSSWKVWPRSGPITRVWQHLYCVDYVRSVFEEFMEEVLKVSREFLDGVWGVSGWCLVGVCSLSG